MRHYQLIILGYLMLIHISDRRFSKIVQWCLASAFAVSAQYTIYGRSMFLNWYELKII